MLLLLQYPILIEFSLQFLIQEISVTLSYNVMSIMLKYVDGGFVLCLYPCTIGKYSFKALKNRKKTV